MDPHFWGRSTSFHKSIIAALKSDYVGEPGLAEQISKNYYQLEDIKVEKGETINSGHSCWPHDSIFVTSAESEFPAELKQVQTEQISLQRDTNKAEKG